MNIDIEPRDILETAMRPNSVVLRAFHDIEKFRHLVGEEPYQEVLAAIADWAGAALAATLKKQWGQR